MRSVLPRNFCPSAHIGGQVLTSEGQTCSLGRTFTNDVAGGITCDDHQATGYALHLTHWLPVLLNEMVL